MKLATYLNEIFDKPVPYKVTTKNKDQFYAGFIIDKQKYKFEADFEVMDDENDDGYDYEDDYEPDEYDKEWNIVFALIDPRDSQNSFTNITKTGNEFKVFATIIDIFTKFIQIYKPESFNFCAKEASRQKLYDRFTKTIQSKFGYKFYNETNSHGEKVYIFRKV